MTEPQPAFTPYPDVNAILAELIAGVQSVLGEQIIGMYLEGSLAHGDFDAASDIDFVVVTTADVSPEGEGSPTFLALQAMHDRLAAFDEPWNLQLEGFYLSRQALRRHAPDLARVPNLERGSGERLKLVRLDQGWDVHRWILRERGIPLLGPHPRALIDPVLPAHLHQAMQPILFDWAAGFLTEPDRMEFRGYQSYIVLTICRVLVTLETGTVASKPAAARWAMANLEPRWSGLIERALTGRHAGYSPIPDGDMDGTLALIRLALARWQASAGEGAR